MKKTNNSTEFNLKLPTTAKEFEKFYKDSLGSSFDLIIENIKTVDKSAVLIFYEGLSNKDLVDRDVIRPLKDKNFDGNIKGAINASFTTYQDTPTILNRILDANVAVYYEGESEVLILDLKQWDKRSVETPDAEIEARGPKEQFTESIVTNIALIRRKLKTTNLTIDRLVIGRQSATTVALIYLENIVNKKVLAEVKERLSKLDVDAILETSQIEQFIEEKSFCIISGMGLTQKPDVAASRILEGRVALLIDGSPHALTIPELFIENIQASGDYYSRTLYGNFLRLLRFTALFITVILPGFAIAIMSYRIEMIPFPFLINFIKGTTGTPLPFSLEILFLIIMFELLKEAGLRMPKAIGAAITIVGALIIGQAAVDAGIVAAPSIIIVALTAVTGLIVPNLNEFTTIYRFLFIFLAAVFGVIGLVAGVMVALIELISKDSFGIPMLSTFSKEELKDSFIRFPLKKLIFRPKSIVKNNRKRNNFDQEQLYK